MREKQGNVEEEGELVKGEFCFHSHLAKDTEGEDGQLNIPRKERRERKMQEWKLPYDCSGSVLRIHSSSSSAYRDFRFDIVIVSLSSSSSFSFPRLPSLIPHSFSPVSSSNLLKLMREKLKKKGKTVFEISQEYPTYREF